MDFGILGPLEVRDGDQALALGGTKQRALLAILLLHANEVVSSDRLIAELWGGERLEDASKTLQVAVSRLRRTLEPDRAGKSSGLLVTRPPGYELRLERGQLDVERFNDQAVEGRAALSAGDAELAAERLRGALALWRGPPLADLGYESFSQAEISRLEELRIAVVEDRIAADLELGRHQDLVAELQDLEQRHPVRERLRGQLMLALYRCGRQADALDVYQDARNALTEELGIEPGRELRELQGAILRQDPGLDLPAEKSARPAARISHRGVFVGRERELAALADALDDALNGSGRLALLVGEPGIGKSRLADELMGQARARGARVLVGRCWEAGGAPAYWPWVQSLRAYVHEAEPHALRTQLGAGAADLAQLLPELYELLPDLPEEQAQRSESARFRLFESVSAFLREAARAGPLVIMLDDLHAADEPSLLLLRFVARELAGSRLMVVCALRDVDPTLREPLTAALAELVREPQTALVGLGGLRGADVADYIELSTGTEPAPRLVEMIHAETEGNPLFVAEVVKLLEAEGRIAEPDAHLSIPPGVRAVIGQRVRRLSEPCRDLLVAASVMGREFGLDSVGRLTELPQGELLGVLDEAIDERVVTDVPGSPGRLRFGHALIRDTLYDDLPSARRLQLHQRAARALEEVYAADLEPHLAELAHHCFAAAPAGSAQDALSYARRAGDRAASQLAYEEAVRLYEMALTLVGEDATRCDLLLVLGDAQARAGDTPAARATFRAAADLAEPLGLDEHLARAALGYGGRLIWEVSRGDVHHVPLLERALAASADQDSPTRVKLLARLAAGPLRDAIFPLERRRVLSEQALEMARRIGDPGTLAYALAGYIPANHSPDFIPTQVVLATELIQVATDVGELERAAEGYENRLTALIELGDLRGAKADVNSMAKLAKELRQPSQDWFVEAYSALMALFEGDFAEAEELIESARRVGEHTLPWNAAVTHGLQLYLLRREQGRLEEVEELVRRSADEYTTYVIWRCVLCQTLVGLGHAEEARETLDGLAADDFSALPFDEEWLVAMGFLAEAASLLEAAEHAAVIYRSLAPYSDRVAVCYPEISTGSVARALGLMATAMENWDDAERDFEQALEVNERIGARPWLARTQRDYGQILVARGAAGDRQRGELLLSRASASYRELGMG